MKLDFRMISRLGLSLDSRKLYHMVQCPCTGAIFCVYEDLDKALHSVLWSPEDYDAKFDRGFSGYYYEFQKGFYQNLSVWEILKAVEENVQSNMCVYGNEGAKDIEEARMDVLYYQFFDNKIQPYKEYLWETREAEREIWDARSSP